MAEFRQISETFWAAPQLEPADFQRAADAGVRLVINNRVEGESPDQLPAAEAAALARRAGLAYAHIPVNMRTLAMGEVEAMASALRDASGPVLAYCLSGARSALLWALAEAGAGAPAEALIESARGAGYDLEPYRETLQRLAAPHADG